MVVGCCGSRSLGTPYETTKGWSMYVYRFWLSNHSFQRSRLCPSICMLQILRVFSRIIGIGNKAPLSKKLLGPRVQQDSEMSSSPKLGALVSPGGFERPAGCCRLLLSQFCLSVASFICLGYLLAAKRRQNASSQRQAMQRGHHPAIDLCATLLLPLFGHMVQADPTVFRSNLSINISGLVWVKKDQKRTNHHYICHKHTFLLKFILQQKQVTKENQ